MSLANLSHAYTAMEDRLLETVGQLYELDDLICRAVLEGDQAAAEWLVAYAEAQQERHARRRAITAACLEAKLDG